jgi:hypothetical protein
MKRKFITICAFVILIVFYAKGQNPNQIAMIPKPKSVQIDKALFKL